MTVLSTIQGVCKVIGLDVPSAVFSSTDREHEELSELANDIGGEITDAYDWQKLKKINTHTGDGSTEAFSLASDYDRMLKKAQVWSSSLETPLTPITDADAWLGLDVQSFDFVINAWIIYNNQMHIKPALDTGVTAKYFYSTGHFALDNDGTTTKSAFDADNDTFRLTNNATKNERLLKLGMICQWRKNKRLPYEEDEEKYEALKERMITNDKGSRMLRVGKIRFPKDVTVAYPQSIQDA